MEVNSDFSGWASKNGLKCSDGRTIEHGAFEHQDGMKVPLVWQHRHNEPTNVLGYAILQHREEGVYAHGYFNDTPAAENAKELLRHGDIEAMSIYANQLVEKSKHVLHGNIREVSLVLSGANPGALIENVTIQHGDDTDILGDEAYIYTGLGLELSHAEENNGGNNMADGKTVGDVFNSMSEEQKNVVYYMIGQALEDQGGEAKQDDMDDDESLSHDEDDDDDNDTGAEMQHDNMGGSTVNVFQQSGGGQTQTGGTLQHDWTADELKAVVEDAKRLGSYKEALLAHAENYGITNVEVLFPDAQTVEARPEWITRKMEWVDSVLNGARKLPFSRIKSQSADLTHEEARAKGYIKGDLKKEQYFAIAGRETYPKTIYKKQKLDRDDMIDVTDFDIAAWIWTEMRFMLNEEIARAILIGDGREPDDEDKIDEDKIRPIAHDDEFYTHTITVPANVDPEGYIEAVLRARPKYKGQGNPVGYAEENLITDLLLIEDKLGRRKYANVQEVAAAMRLSNLVPVEVMEGAKHDEKDLLMVIVNMGDYAIGTDKGGQITTFDDFDIDYNQYKYLIEGRMSGALLKHKRAMRLVRIAGTLIDVTNIVPTFDAATGNLTIPTVTGVTYHDASDDSLIAAGANAAYVASGSTVEVYAAAAEGYNFPHNFDADWEFTAGIY